MVSEMEPAFLFPGINKSKSLCHLMAFPELENKIKMIFNSYSLFIKK